MSRRRRALGASTLLTALLVVTAPSSAQDATGAAPSTGTDTAIATLQSWLSALSKATPGDAGLAPLVDVLAATHDASSIAADAVGPAWETLDAATRHRFEAAFAPWLAARQLACSGGTGATFAAPRPKEDEDAKVFSTEATSAEGQVTVQFGLMNGEHGWRITAVTIDGDSLAESFRRSEAPTLADGDLGRVIADVQQQTALFGANASAVVARLQAALSAAMKGAHELHYAGRDRLLAPVVTATHDLPFIARFVVRQQWKDLTAEQQQRFVDAFRELSLASYAARFDGWSGETFEITGEQEMRGGYRLVKSVLNRPDDEPIRFDYMLHREDCRWQIINILVDGVSDLATKQREYQAIMADDGFDTLVEKIRQQTEKYRSESED